MRRCIILASVASLMLTGCFATRIVTVSPVSGYPGTSTTVTIPRTTATTTTAHVTAVSEDISLCLDLQAVGAAFAQSSTIEEFENLLNDSSYMLSNLDLNGDGYVDYLRVVETVEGNAHVFVIQAVLADNVYQDVATLVAEVTTVYANACVQIIGSPYIYGPKYIIQPVYVAVPAIYPYLVRPRYAPWRSPWYWGHFPPHYRHPKPIYVSHYHAYVNTYMRNHRYCHEFRYAPSCHFPEYERVSRPMQRNDYGVKHPERSFVERNANTPARSVSGEPAHNVVNAREIREAVDAASVTRSASGSTSRAASRSVSGSSTASDSKSSSSVSGSRGSSSGTTENSGRSSSSVSGSRSTSPATTSSSSSSSSSRSQTTVRSNVSNSGSARTRISTTTSSGTSSSVSRSSSTSRSSSSVKSSSGSASRSSNRSSSSSGSASRSSSSTRSSGNSSSSSRTGSRR